MQTVESHIQMFNKVGKCYFIARSLGGCVWKNKNV